MRRALVLALVAAVLLPGAAVAAPPPQRIVFVSDRTGTAQAYSVSPTRPSALAELTFGAEPVRQALPSPSGRFVALARGSSLVVGLANGSALRVIAANATSPTWTPDSRRFAFSRTPRDGIWAVRRDGSGLARLTSGNDYDPAWSPDGKRLLFLRGTSGDLVVRRLGRELTLVHGVRAAVWSPNSRWIAYQPDPTDGSFFGVYLVRPDGSKPMPIDGGAYDPAWAPDSRRLAYVTGGGIVIKDVVTGRTRTLVPDLTASVFPKFASPEWSPDGRTIAYLYGNPLLHELRVVDVNTGHVRTFRIPSQAVQSLVWTRPPPGLPYRPAEPIGPVVRGSEVRVRSPIRQIAADGDRVAFSACGGVWSWRVGEKLVRTPRDEFPLCQTTNGAVYGLAVAGDAVAYAVRSGGIQVRWELAAVWPGAPPLPLSSGASCCAGDPLLPAAGFLLGNGTDLAYSTWTIEQFPKRVGKQTVWRASPAGPSPVATGEGRLDPLALDAGRIVVREASGAVTILALDGRRLLTIPYLGDQAADAELDGNDLVVLERDGRLVRYDAGTGATVSVIAFQPGGRLVGLARGRVAWMAASDLQVRALAGNTILNLRDVSAARLDDSGLFYARTVPGPWPGRVLFVPSASL
jgi:Tol biopolymer transport system component